MQIVLNHIRYPVLLLLLFCLCNSSYAQSWRAGIYSGYSSNSFDAFGKEYFKIAGSQYSGFDIEYLTDQTFGLKLSYARQETKAATNCNSAVGPMRVERFEFGFTARKAVMQKKLEWATGLGFGVCKLINGGDERDGVKFASSFNAGLNYHISKFIGIQVQGRVLQFYSKNAEGCNINTRAEASMDGTVVTQGAITGGFLFSIGK